jgi:hypothetical protein
VRVPNATGRYRFSRARPRWNARSCERTVSGRIKLGHWRTPGVLTILPPRAWCAVATRWHVRAPRSKTSGLPSTRSDPPAKHWRTPKSIAALGRSGSGRAPGWHLTPWRHLPHSDTTHPGAPQSRCHSAHQQPRRASRKNRTAERHAMPAHRRRQPAHGRRYTDANGPTGSAATRRETAWR